MAVVGEGITKEVQKGLPPLSPEDLSNYRKMFQVSSIIVFSIFNFYTFLSSISYASQVAV